MTKCSDQCMATAGNREQSYSIVILLPQCTSGTDLFQRAMQYVLDEFMKDRVPLPMRTP